MRRAPRVYRDRRRMLTQELRRLAFPFLQRRPRERERGLTRHAADVLEAKRRVDRVRVGVERERLAHAESTDLAREHELARRLLGSEPQVGCGELHRHRRRVARRPGDETAGPQFPHDDHRLGTPILQDQLLELAALATDDGAIERSDDRGEPLRWARPLSTGRRGSRGRSQFLFVFPRSFRSRCRLRLGGDRLRRLLAGLLRIGPGW